MNGQKAAAAAAAAAADAAAALDRPLPAAFAVFLSLKAKMWLNQGGWWQ